MERLVVHTDRVPPARVPLSQAIRAGEWVFASGQLGMDPQTGHLIKGGIKAETRQVCENLKAVLEAGGTTLARVVKVTIYMADLGELMRQACALTVRRKRARAPANNAPPMAAIARNCGHTTSQPAPR